MSETEEQVVWTRPQHIITKKGTSGQGILLRTNYYPVRARPDWCLCAYHVSFNPEETRTPVKKLLLRQHCGVLGHYIFDGAQMFLSHKLIRDIFSILLRRCYEYLGLTKIGKHYYDAKREIQNPKHQVAIWPGQISSIRQHEHQILLMTDVIHKFLRLDTVYTLLRRLHTTHPNNLEYQVTVRDPHQPLLLSRPRKRDQRRGQKGNIYLIPELCVATGVSQAMRSDPRLMQDLAASTRLGPDQRVQALTKFNTTLFTNEKVKTELDQWGLSFSQELAQVRGRILPGEVLTQAHHSFTYTGSDGDWAREVKDVPLSVCREVGRWVLVFPSRQRKEAEELVAGLRKVTPTLGMVMPQPAMEMVQGDGPQDYIKALGKHMGVGLVVCVVPNSRLDRYVAVKRHVCMVMAAPSQMVLAKSLQHKGRLLAIVTRVAIQINCKLGGEAWSVQMPLRNTMVVGYDAYHEGGRRGGASWGAVVASYNQNLTRYFGQVTRHASHQELANNFSAAVTSKEEREDGVGDGQLNYVRDTEVAAIRECFAAFNFNPGFSFVVVSKRIHSRLFAEGATTGRPVNPPPGTVCDDVITLPERYDFFLVSQRVTEGTVTPTSYNILVDHNTNLDPDRHQRLAYKLSFLYYNWMGPVRVPAPCLYAHKLASITGQAIHDSPPPSLADKLWYL
ncbi:Piwi-like protein 1 [Portunus trituberculatus]|uniref:Piwi-like protein 1 n=1 Tax=Portunus trituberculatus TaxID=210409 RepID=A0A5B7F9Z4_PORTR|nr:Piwi-like protein 1 [Portunus trituberculatus]